jgi:hypothetical protein
MDVEDLWTQAELAGRMGVSRQRVGQIHRKIGIEPMWIGKVMFYTPNQVKVMMNRTIGKPGRPQKTARDGEGSVVEEDTGGHDAPSTHPYDGQGSQYCKVST